MEWFAGNNHSVEVAITRLDYGNGTPAGSSQRVLQGYNGHPHRSLILIVIQDKFGSRE